ncbi:hypothetical protein MRX96_001892 [Rhipicephalus microplus]
MEVAGTQGEILPAEEGNKSGINLANLWRNLVSPSVHTHWHFTGGHRLESVSVSVSGIFRGTKVRGKKEAHKKRNEKHETTHGYGDYNMAGRAKNVVCSTLRA